MIVVCNSSPLISLARAGMLELLPQLFTRIHIADEVHREVVVLGTGRPAAAAVEAAPWIERHGPADAAALASLRALHPLGSGELATLLLAQSLGADLAIIDERAARRLARAGGIAVMGCVGVIETGFRRGVVPDLRETYTALLAQGSYIDRHIVNRSLAAFGLPAL